MNAIISALATAMTTALTPTKTTFRLMAGASSGQQITLISATKALCFTVSIPVVIVIKINFLRFVRRISRTRQAGRAPSRSSQNPATDAGRI